MITQKHTANQTQLAVSIRLDYDDDDDDGDDGDDGNDGDDDE